MDDFTAYKIYRALKLHFSSKTYNVIESRGFVKGITLEKYKSQRFVPWFKFLSKQFSKESEFVQFVVANCAYGDIENIFEYDTALINYETWQKNKKKSTYLITETVESIDHLKDKLTGLPPSILNLVIQDKVNIETAVAINRCNTYIPESLLSKDYHIFSKIALKIKKLDNFVKYDEEKVNNTIKSALNT
jgi:hypothetical protein